MARRASTRISTGKLVLSLLILIIAVAGVYFLINNFSNPYRTIQPLDLASYLENANSLRGNVYRLEGLVQNSLAWSPAKGRLISVEIEAKNNSEIVAIFVPATFNHLNLQKGQRFQFKIEIAKDGVMQAQDLRKS